jgi:hypothetical protein
MRHRIQTIAIAALASALTVAGLAVAGDRHGGSHGGRSPFAFAGPGGKSLTYSETHLRKDGEDVTLRVDQGRVLAASASAISIKRNDGETVEVPVDGDTKVFGGWWRDHDDGNDQAKAAHNERRGGLSVADIPEGKRVIVARTDDDDAVESIALVRRHHWHKRHRDHDDD